MVIDAGLSATAGIGAAGIEAEEDGEIEGAAQPASIRSVKKSAKTTLVFFIFKGTLSFYCFFCSERILAAEIVFFKSIAIVIGPTPPGTGVIA